MKSQHQIITTSLLGLKFGSVIMLTPARHFKTLVAGLILACTIGTEAAPVYFFNDVIASRTAFQAAASGPLTLESFEQNFPGGVSVSFPVDGPEAFTVVSSVGGGIYEQSSFARGVTHGLSAMAINEDPPGLTLTFLFNSPIYAFGLDVNDLNFVSMSFADNLGNNNTSVLLGDNGGPAGGPDFQNLQFFGVVNADAFSQVQLIFASTSTGGGTIFLDRLEFTTVPEPSTVAIMGLGALGLMFYSTKRRPA